MEIFRTNNREEAARFFEELAKKQKNAGFWPKEYEDILCTVLSFYPAEYEEQLDLSFSCDEDGCIMFETQQERLLIKKWRTYSETTLPIAEQTLYLLDNKCKRYIKAWFVGSLGVCDEEEREECNKCLKELGIADFVGESGNPNPGRISKAFETIVKRFKTPIKC